jgi:site-specific recombinase XerC
MLNKRRAALLTDRKFTQVLTTWSEAFEAWLYEHDRMPKTVLAYLQDVRHFSYYFERVNQQIFTPEQLNATDIRAYFAQQDDDLNVSPASRNRRLASLRVLVEWSVEIGLLEYDPTVSIKRQKIELMPRDRSSDEMQRLDMVVIQGLHIRCVGDGHAWLTMRDRILWSIFVHTGLRIHEVAALDVDNLDFKAAKITVIGKGNKKATISVPTTFMAMLTEWLTLRPISAGETLITGWNGQRLTTGQIRRRIKMIGEAAGIHDLKPHDIRHWYAYWLKDELIRLGISEEKALDGVRKQLRHGDIKTTLLYFRVRESQIRKAVEGMK